MLQQPVVAGIFDTGKLVGQPPLVEEDLAVYAGKDTAVHQQIP
ncbi:hypothetical protein ACIPLC_37430 [Kitasatospora sp. NPDC086801]